MADRIPFLQKLTYSVGVLVNNLQAAAMPAMVVILNLGLGIDPFLVGVIGFAPRIFDAISDPVIGYLSDNTNSRWGRRRPYIFAGAILSGLIFAMMWQLPEGYSESFYFWVFLVASVFYFLAYTTFATPLVAFGYEMSPDYHERTRLFAFANSLGQLPWLAVPWFYAIMANQSLFENEVIGARSLALWVGGAVCLLGIIPAVYCRERQTLPTNNVVKNQTKADFSIAQHCREFFRGVSTTIKCRPFAQLCTATFLVFNGYQLGNSFTLYVLIYYVYGGDKEAASTLNGWYGSITSLCSLLSIPVVGWVATKIGKRQTFLLTTSLSLFGYALKWFGYNQEYPYLLLVACPFISLGIGSLFTLMSSMNADVCDYDELTSFQRREGLFGAIFWWMVKIGIAIAGLLFGMLLNATGFDVGLASKQPESTLLWMRIYDVCIPILTSLFAIWIIYGYGITESKAREIRTELEQRKEQDSSYVNIE